MNNNDKFNNNNNSNSLLPFVNSNFDQIDEKFDDKAMLPSYLKNKKVLYDMFYKESNTNIPNEIKGGYKSYKPLLLIESINNYKTNELETEIKKLIDGLN